MRIRSHLDPTLFIVFLHVNAREYDEEFKALARSLRASRGTNVQPLFAALRDRERRTMAHERYHFWQGLRLPFLHLYATLTYRHAFIGARDLARIVEDWRCWTSLGAVPRGFDRLDISFHMAGNELGQLVLGTELFTGYQFHLDFSAKEMLECAASIYDYQASCKTFADISNPVSFERWRKRHPAYLKIFDFCAGFFASRELALRTILPLLNAAFHTSLPERALFELTGRTGGTFALPDSAANSFLAQREPCRWPELFQKWLGELDYDHSFGSWPEKIDLNEGKYYYLDPEKCFGAALGGGLQHPFLGPPALEWQKETATIPALKHYLDLPGYVSNQEAHEFAFNTEPQLRIIRVFLEDGSDKVFAIGEGLVGPAFVDAHFSKFSASEFRGFILDLLAAYGAFRRATGAQMTDAARTCYHRDCPHFEANYCNCYPLIPERFEDCGFPDRLRQWITVVRR